MCLNWKMNLRSLNESDRKKISAVGFFCYMIFYQRHVGVILFPKIYGISF
jgi:hypothetical protein